MYRLLYAFVLASVVASPVSLSQQAGNGRPDYITLVDGELTPDRIPPYEAAWAVFGMLQTMAERLPPSAVSRRVGLDEAAIPALMTQIDAVVGEYQALYRRHVEEQCDDYSNNVITTAADYVAESKRQDEEANRWREERIAEILSTLDEDAVAALQAQFREVRENMKWGMLDYGRFAASPRFDLARVYAAMCDAADR